MDLLKEHWENPSAGQENVVAFVVKMRERLEQMTVLAEEHMNTAYANQKTWYDRKVRDRVFHPGQQVLLQLPTGDSKLLAKWQGPYQITKRLGKVTYELYLPDKLKKHQCFHVNLVKEFQVPIQQSVQQQLHICAFDGEEEREQSFPTNVSEPSAMDVVHLQLMVQSHCVVL